MIAVVNNNEHMKIKRKGTKWECENGRRKEKINKKLGFGTSMLCTYLYTLKILFYSIINRSTYNLFNEHKHN